MPCMTFPADGTDLAFFGTEQPASVHCLTAFWILVCSGESKKSVLFLLRHSKHCSEIFMRVRFWSAVSKCGIHLAQSFFISNSSCKIHPTHSFEMPIVSTISRTFVRRSPNTVWCTCSMISGVVALFGLPSRGSSSRLVRPCLNSAAHFLIVENKGEESP